MTVTLIVRLVALVVAIHFSAVLVALVIAGIAGRKGRVSGAQFFYPAFAWTVFYATFLVTL